MQAVRARPHAKVDPRGEGVAATALLWRVGLCDRFASGWPRPLVAQWARPSDSGRTLRAGPRALAGLDLLKKEAKRAMVGLCSQLNNWLPSGNWKLGPAWKVNNAPPGSTERKIWPSNWRRPMGQIEPQGGGQASLLCLAVA